jgi:hypothetical protein
MKTDDFKAALISGGQINPGGGHMSKKNNSIIKTVTIVVFFVALILIFFNIVSRRNASSKYKASKNELEDLLTYDIEGSYPNSARDVVKLHCRYSKLLYGTELDDDELSKISDKMRLLYSSALLSYNPSEDALQAMKDNIAKMEEEGYTYKAYTLPEDSQINYYTQNGLEMASMVVTITMGTSEDPGYYYREYTLVKENSKWKIYGWGEAQNPDTTEQE